MNAPRSSSANCTIRFALAAMLVFHTIFGALLTAEMAAAQAGAAPGDTVVICTPEGMKAVPWSQLSGEEKPPSSGCACACATTCCHGATTSPALLATPVAYPSLNETGHAYGVLNSDLQETQALGNHGARAPPLLPV